ncbi:replication initiation and membrane attachment family protein [Bacillus xiapuensis]|uniref:replication initiation and membrane attachment family protein n=1 Tax=Bacillus xiapuensis TaxID=2014075 RepID=UPI000C23E417|nr:replication initiation and membrane attachment family protein [Bacillus xiapuensis]
MNRHWNEIQPVDMYSVCLAGVLHELDRKVLTMLYQPLIGARSFSLYMTLWAEVEENRLCARESNHYHLMNFLNINIQEIYDSRLQLEALGLLKTYARKHDELREFIYELQPPLSPEHFFNDGMLNVFLFRKIGRSHFSRLKAFFADHLVDKSAYHEVTRDFQEVFSAGQMTLDPEAMKASLLPEDQRYAARKSSEGVPLSSEQFDFSLLESSLKGAMLSRAVLTPSIKEMIAKLSFLYGIGPLEMKNLLLTAMDERDEIDMEVLRKAARDWYQLEKGNDLPELIPLVQPPALRTAAPEPSTKEEELIDYLETTSPRQLLIDISGSLPSKSDMQVIEGALFQHKLPAGVVNVLIQYVLIKTDMKLSKSYVDKIASHWARKKVKTVKEAMELAKNEHRQYLDWAKNKQKNSRKVMRTEKLPEWFHKKDDDSVPSDDGQMDVEAKRRELEEKIKNRRLKRRVTKDEEN